MLEEYEDILTVEEACQALKIGYNAIYALLNSGKLKGYRNGRVWRIPKVAVKAYILDSAGLKKEQG
ncbi:MAG: helix-turn-helix domain-containing protein [Oscillibacter sp.]|nr:helix-turn-helix domain-containing protein [Oscillibacter sp.]